MVGKLVSVNVGLPKNVQWRDKTVYTGIWKTPVEGPVMVRRLNLDGDGQGDLAGHGGEQRAVMVYQTESYDFWKQYLGRDDLVPGHSGKTSRSPGCPTMMCASVTATGSGKPSSKSLSPESPAFVSVCA